MPDGSIPAPAPVPFIPGASTVAQPTVENDPVALRADVGRRLVRRAGLLLLGAVGLAAGTFGVGVLLTPSNAVAARGFTIVALVALAGAGTAVYALMKPGHRLGAALLACANLAMALFGGLLALVSRADFTRGRQLRRFGRVLLPRVEQGAGWSGATLADVQIEDPELRVALAAQWRENGRTEHASVAAFARLSLDLLALGAPPALVAATSRDALDEIRHAELCFGLARALDGHDRSPAAFPEAQRARTLPATRVLALAALAGDSLVDGALHEGVSARIIARLARRCEEPQIRAILREIAADEGRHAAHGWDVVAYCVAEGGAPVASALAGAAARLPKQMVSDLPVDAIGGGWERHGIHGRALEGEEFAKAREELVRRVSRLVETASKRAA